MPNHVCPNRRSHDDDEQMTSGKRQSNEEIRVVIVDQHPIFIRGLRHIIEAEFDLRVVGEATSGRAGLGLVKSLLPQVAVLDLDMPKLEGLELVREMHRLNLPVEIVCLTIHSEVGLLQRAIDLGGRGYVLKESALHDIVGSIRYAHAGRPFVSSLMTPALLERRARVVALNVSKPGLAELTVTERRILGLIAAGNSTKDIALLLRVQRRTIDAHRANICHKLDLAGSNSLVRFAIEHQSELVFPN